MAIFRFTIRDLLWLTVVVAFAVLWCGEMRQRALDSAEIAAENRRLAEEREYALNLLGQQRALREGTKTGHPAGPLPSRAFTRVRMDRRSRG